MVRLSKKCAEITLDEPVELLNNLKMNLGEVDQELTGKDFYGKVIGHSGEDSHSHVVRFTSVPAEVRSYFQAHRQYASWCWVGWLCVKFSFHTSCCGSRRVPNPLMKRALRRTYLGGYLRSGWSRKAKWIGARQASPRNSISKEKIRLKWLQDNRHPHRGNH